MNMENQLTKTPENLPEELLQEEGKFLEEQMKRLEEKIGEFDGGSLDRKTYKGISGGFGTYAQRDPARHMVRLRLPGGRLPSAQLKFIADSIERYQVEKIKLTTCETVQLHDLTAGQVPQLIREAAGAGIICRGGGGDNPRNVMCSPLSGVQPGECFDVMPYAEAASRYLLSIASSIHMPRKLKVAFCNGADDSVHSAFRDMGFLAQADGTFSLRIAGGLGANYKMGLLVDPKVKPEEVLYYIKAMVDTFCEHGNYENRAKARTRYLQETLGPEGLKEVFLANVEKAKKTGGLELKELCRPDAAAFSQPSGDSLERRIPQKQPGLYAVKYHPIGGLLPKEMPEKLYQILKEIPKAECRIAAHGTIYVINLSEAEAETVLRATEDGARTEFESSVACIGASICQQGVRDSQAVLAAAVKAVREAEIPDGALPKICISGCPSSCSAHQAAAIGFQGAAKMIDKKPMPAFKLFLGGSDQLGAARFGEPDGTLLETDIPAFLVEIGRAAAARGLSYGQWSSQYPEELRALVEKYA